MPALAAAYAGPESSLPPLNALLEAVKTNDPRLAASAAWTARATWNADPRLTANSASHSEADTSPTGPRPARPARCTTWSLRQNC